MVFQWGKSNVKGLRYREHPTKTVGAGRYKRPLRYYVMTYKWQGRTISEALGWENEIFTEWRGKTINGEAAAEQIYSQLRNNRQNSTPPFTLAEIRIQNQAELDDEIRRAETEKNRIEQEENTVINKIFAEYCESNEHKVSLRDEKAYYQNWIGPTIGKKRLEDVVLLDLQRIAKKMTDAGRAPRSIQYVKSIVRQLYHYAIDHKLYSGVVPTTSFLRKQKIDNRRQRYLDPEEAEKLLARIRTKSETTYRVSLLSLHGGMRFGEIAALRWQHINTDRREILVVDAKNGETRSVYMTDTVLNMFLEMDRSGANRLVFPAKIRRGTEEKQMDRISNVFAEAVKALGLNDGITDRRLLLVFHSLRHSCASTLVNAGIELPVIAKILGHKTLAMTMRYSHVNDQSVRSAMDAIDKAHSKTKENVFKLKQR